MARHGTLAALIALLSACITSSSPQTVTGDLQVSVELERPAGAPPVPREGDLSLLVFRVHNASSRPIILRDLTQPRDLMRSASSGSVASWQFAQNGLVTYIAEQDEWFYDRSKRADPPRPVFNSGLLVPNEKLTVRARVRLLEMPMDFQFSYFELTPEDLRRKVYFEEKKDKILRYRTMIGRELDLQLRPSERSDDAGHRFVIFPHAEPVSSTTLRKTLRFEQALKPRAFTLEQAARRAQVPKPADGTYSYSLLFDAWVLPRESGHVLVTPAAVTQLPELRQMERLFYVLDMIGSNKMEVDLRSHSCASAFGDLKWQIVKQTKEIPITREVREKRDYYYIYLAPEQIPRFLGDLRNIKGVLDVEFGEGGGRLVVTNR